ncbi:MAG: hypothetical protein ABIK96_15335 [bacterium]
MMWQRNRLFLLSYFAVLAVFVVIGCSSKEDPSETLAVCGNHSCGELIMVTTDTTSDGFQYLDPVLSPDGTRIMFTADWWAIPTERDPGDEPYVTNRQVLLMPVTQGFEPKESIVEQGAELVLLNEYTLHMGGAGATIVLIPAIIQNERKASPKWITDDRILFSYLTNRGFRLFSADITTPGSANVDGVMLIDGLDTGLLYNGAPMRGDNQDGGFDFQILDPAVSPDGRWAVCTFFASRVNIITDGEREYFEFLGTQSALIAVDLWTLGDGNGYDTSWHYLTGFYSNLRTPAWSPEGRRIVFSGGMDVGGGTGIGTELFLIDFDPDAAASGASVLDAGLRRLTFTSYTEGDPITGVLNDQPAFTNDGSAVYFVSTRRAPSITLHDRNIWKVPADGSLDPEIYYFTRSDDWTPSVMADGSLLLSSQLGFPTEMLDRLEEEAYQDYLEENETLNRGWTEVEMREMAAGERDLLSFFEGVMSHLYIFRP